MKTSSSSLLRLATRPTRSSPRPSYFHPLSISPPPSSHRLPHYRPFHRPSNSAPAHRPSGVAHPSSQHSTPSYLLPRYYSTTKRPSPLTSRPTSSPQPPSPTAETTPPVPSYDLTFTCRPCSHRSTHRITKQGYHSGTVLITCPECKNRHVIADHLKIFSDEAMDVETLMREKGELVRRGRLGAGEEGDVEFWDEGEEGTEGRGLGPGENGGKREA